MTTYRRTILAISAVAIGLSIGPVHAAGPKAGDAATDWPQYRFDNEHTAYNPAEKVISLDNVAGLQLAWQAPLSSGELAGVDEQTPTVADGVVYIGTHDGEFFAFPADGCGNSVCTKPLWRSVNLASGTTTAAVANGIVYVGSQTSFNSNNGKLNAFAAAGCGKPVCKPLWRGDAGPTPPAAAPTVADGVVYTTTYNGHLFAFDANGCGQKLCQPLWVGKMKGFSTSTPTVHDGVVYVGTYDTRGQFQGGGRLYAFSAAGCGASTCKPLWYGSMDDKRDLGAFDTPTYSNGLVFVTSEIGKISAFHAEGCGAQVCNPLWQAKTEGGALVVAGDTIYAQACKNVSGGAICGVGVYSISKCATSPHCRLQRLYFSVDETGGMSDPIVANGLIYARFGQNLMVWSTKPCGAFFCREKQAVALSAALSGSPSISNGTVYIGTTSGSDNQGTLLAFKLAH
jgi:outer membrane protein assembly factor BamB